MPLHGALALRAHRVSAQANCAHAAIDEDEACVLWIGAAPQAIPTVAALQAQLAGWSTLPAAIAAHLTCDQQAATPPTPLQRWVLQLMDGAQPAGGRTSLARLVSKLHLGATAAPS